MKSLLSKNLQTYQCVSARFNSLENALKFICTFPADDFYDLFTENMVSDDAPYYCTRVYIVRYFKWCTIVKTDDKKKAGEM